jgi:hypothetical protein
VVSLLRIMNRTTRVIVALIAASGISTIIYVVPEQQALAWHKHRGGEVPFIGGCGPGCGVPFIGGCGPGCGVPFIGGCGPGCGVPFIGGGGYQMP